MDELAARLGGGELILLDGATGTELQRRGVPMDAAAWSAAALVTHPQTVREVHEDYIRAGADVVTTNSFSTAWHQLEPAGLGDRFRELNARAVELARQARENAADRPVAVAGSISSAHFELEHRATYAMHFLRNNAAMAAGATSFAAFDVTRRSSRVPFDA